MWACWFWFMYYQKWNCTTSLFQKQNYNVLPPTFYIHVSVGDLYSPTIGHRHSADRSWEYINQKQHSRPMFESRLGTPRKAPPTEPEAVKIWRWASANVTSEWLYECMYCNIKINMLKEWQKAIKHLNRNQTFILDSYWILTGPSFAV